jgi:hypothetical protein
MTDFSMAIYDILLGGKALKAYRATSMYFVRGNSNFSP